jgi:hypothetical protein
VRTLLGATGGGTGVAIAYEVIQAMRQRPEFLGQLVNGGALYMTFAIVALVIVDRRLSRSADLQVRNVVAQEELARHFGELVERDDVRAQAQEAALRYLSAMAEDISKKVNELHARQN